MSHIPHPHHVVVVLSSTVGGDLNTNEIVDTPRTVENVLEGDFEEQAMESYVSSSGSISLIKERVKESYFLSGSVGDSKNLVSFIIKEWKDKNTENETCLVSPSQIWDFEVNLGDFEDEEDNEVDNFISR